VARRPFCSQNAHEEKDGEGTHVGPVLPERAPSEGPRSTAALSPTWVSSPVEKLADLEGSHLTSAFEGQSGCNAVEPRLVKFRRGGDRGGAVFI